MNRRKLLTSLTAFAGAAVMTEPSAHSGHQSTHVDTKTGGPLLLSGIVKAESLRPEGAAPGAKAYVYCNGPTSQLAAIASGFVTLEPGAQPHPPHKHPEEEIMIVGDGTGEFSINGVTTEVKKGDMVFAESNVLHGVRNTGQTHMTFYFMKMMAKSSSLP
jgi:quercetin dioxygenase-like cupin family protein